MLDLLSQLVSKSLVLSELRPHQPARYRLLEPAFLDEKVIVLCAPLFKRFR